MNSNHSNIPRQIELQNSFMSAQTKDFIQRICFQPSSSLDMRSHGFISDSHPLKLFIKPLRNQLENILGKAIN
ncbi:unnamed protein product [Leptidea sinapis]|uniref:Uncharacterized protein n=1 Tax=Leptidea sinapis TaxID=189913 RepID=A0A5E4QX13_9NEOP|nr:unnamed protein product [Leptidea sinapis]